MRATVPAIVVPLAFVGLAVVDPPDVADVDPVDAPVDVAAELLVVGVALAAFAALAKLLTITADPRPDVRKTT